MPASDPGYRGWYRVVAPAPLRGPAQSPDSPAKFELRPYQADGADYSCVEANGTAPDAAGQIAVRATAKGPPARSLLIGKVPASSLRLAQLHTPEQSCTAVITEPGYQPRALRPVVPEPAPAVFAEEPPLTFGTVNPNLQFYRAGYALNLYGGPAERAAVFATIGRGSCVEKFNAAGGGQPFSGEYIHVNVEGRNQSRSGWVRLDYLEGLPPIAETECQGDLHILSQEEIHLRTPPVATQGRHDLPPARALPGLRR